MTRPEKERAAKAAVDSLLRTDKIKALAVAVLVASSSVAGCTTQPRNEPCPGQPDSPPCLQASGEESGWLTQPRWPAIETSRHGGEGLHLSTAEDFTANPQYTRLRAGQEDRPSYGPRYYGGGHYYFYSSGGTSSSGYSS